VSNVVNTLVGSPDATTAINAITHALTNINESYTTALKNGATKISSRDALPIWDGTRSAAEHFTSLARVIRKISTLNGLTTKVGSGLVQGMNEVIIPSKMLRAQKGDVTQQKFLKNLDPTYDPNKKYTPDEIKNYASLASSYIHGTGDIRSMPPWMLRDSEFSGFFSLAHWSIAQTNNFMKNVYEPATRGDIKPAIVSVFGAIAGGMIIRELRQDISGKKNPIPSLSEISNSEVGIEGNKSLVAYNMISAMQYSGFGGLLSQVAKYPFDLSYGNNPQGATFPLDELTTDLTETVHDVAEAIRTDPNVNWVDLASQVGLHILTNNMQLSKIAINQGIDSGLITGLPAEKKQLSDKLGDLRRFDMVSGIPYDSQDFAGNQFANLEQKKFQYDQDPSEAVEMIPGLVNNIVDKYQNNPDVMMSKLKALKENSYETMPSPENMPLQFSRYYQYLQRAYGTDVANDRYTDYMMHSKINSVKNSVIP
jgi:hypothetical protein